MFIGKNAIVIGNSIAGKLAATVLSNYFEKVTVFENDSKPNDTVFRKGIPQGKHNHILLKGGELALEQLFPGLIRELTEHGSEKMDAASQFRWFHHGNWKVRYNSGISYILQSRPFLEYHIHRRVEQIENIEFHYHTRVSNLLFDPKQNRICGVEAFAEGETSRYYGDLVVDTSGANSITSNWLNQNSIFCPIEKIKIDLCYASRIYERPDADFKDWSGLVLYGNPPRDKRTGAIFHIEQNRFIVSLSGYAGSHPSQNQQAFMEFAKSLPRKDIYEFIKTAKPLSDIEIYRFPAMTRHYFEKVKQFPEGLIALGDSYCRFDPAFGQGITVAALEALELRGLLEETLNKKNGYVLHGFSKRFHKRIAKIVFLPWLMVKSEVLRYPEVAGERPPGLKLLHWYNKHIFNLSAYDKDVYDVFIRVMNFLDHPLKLFQPKIIFQVLHESFIKD